MATLRRMNLFAISLLWRAALAFLIFEAVAWVGSCLTVPELRQSFFVPSLAHSSFAGNDIGGAGSLRRIAGANKVLVLSGSGAQTQMSFKSWAEQFADLIFERPHVDNFSLPGGSDANLSAVMDFLIDKGLRYDLVLIELQPVVSEAHKPDGSAFFYSAFWKPIYGEWIISPRIATTQFKRWFKHDPLLKNSKFIKRFLSLDLKNDRHRYEVALKQGPIEYSDSISWTDELLQWSWRKNAEVLLHKSRQLGEKTIFIGSFIRWREGLPEQARSSFFWLWPSREPGKRMSLKAAAAMMRSKNSVVAEVVKKEGITFLNLDEAVESARMLPMAFRDQFHLDGAGHKIAAEALAADYRKQIGL